MVLKNSKKCYTDAMSLDGSNRFLYAPVAAAILRNRLETAAIVGFGVLQALLAYTHLPGWPCPIKAATGIPCPGCGLSASAGEFLHGDWQASISTHAFAPFFLAALALMGVVVALPDPVRRRVVSGIERFERRTGATAWFLVCFLLYWGLRLGKLL
jgi:predicted membrane-bound mannosyltransferase